MPWPNLFKLAVTPYSHSVHRPEDDMLTSEASIDAGPTSRVAEATPGPLHRSTRSRSRSQESPIPSLPLVGPIDSGTVGQLLEESDKEEGELDGGLSGGEHVRPVDKRQVESSHDQTGPEAREEEVGQGSEEDTLAPVQSSEPQPLVAVTSEPLQEDTGPVGESEADPRQEVRDLVDEASLLLPGQVSPLPISTDRSCLCS